MNSSNRMRLMQIVLSITIGSPIAMAADYYVATNGSDSNPGTVAQPLASFEKAYGLATAGTTIYLRGGTYAPSTQFLLNKSGSSGNPIRLFNYPGEKPVIDGSRMATDGWTKGAPVRVTGNFNHVKGLEVVNGPEFGVAIDKTGSNNILEALDVHHSGWLSDYGGCGIVVFNEASNNLIVNNDSHHNRDRNLGNADGFRVLVTGSGNVFRGNRSWRNSDDGFDLFDSKPVLLEFNMAFENGYDDNLNRLGDGNGFKLGGQHSGQSSGGHMVRNNLAWNNPLHGFDQNGALVAMTLYNNTAWHNGPANPGGEYWGENFYFPSLPNTFRNNLSFDGGVTSSGSASFNSWNLPVTVSSADFVSMTDSSARAARKPDGSLPDFTFMKLAFGSDLIDKGADVGLAYGGSSPDLGAFEYNSAPESPPPVSNLLLNPGFESGLTGWSVSLGGSSAVVTSTKYAGTSSLRVSSGGGGRAQIISGLTPGATYVMTVYARMSAKSKTYDEAYVGINTLDSAGNVTGADIAARVTGRSWKMSTVEFKATDSGRVRVWVWKDRGTEDVFTDDCWVQRNSFRFLG